MKEEQVENLRDMKLKPKKFEDVTAVKLKGRSFSREDIQVVLGPSNTETSVTKLYREGSCKYPETDIWGKMQA